MNYALQLVTAAAFGAFAAGAAFGAEELSPGLIGEYFKMDGEVSDFPDLKNKKPHLVKVDKQINFESTDIEFNETDLRDRFVVRWSGFVKVAKDCRIRFYTESDDGSRLFIAGKQIVDNAGLHGMEEREGEVDLKAGDHEIVVEFFDNSQGAGCKVAWEIQGSPREIIPAGALFHPKSKTPPEPPKKDEPKK
jgi:PA14 domain